MRYTVTLLCTALASPAFAQVPGVMTDTPIVQSLVAQVMGDLGAPGALLDRGADPHAFQMRPSQARALASADLVFWVGPELTPWMERAIEGTGTEGKVVELLGVEGVTLLEFGHGDDHGDEHALEVGHEHGEDHADGDDHADEAEHDHHEEHTHEAGHDDSKEHAQEAGHDDSADHAHGGMDPHAWLNPENARLWLDVIAQELSAADTTNAAIYTANAAAARAAVTTLKADIRATLAPVGDSPIMVFHDAYGYFADYFGLNIVGTIALGDAANPGAARLTEMRDLMTNAGVVCVFPEVNHSPAYAEIVVEGTAARLGGMLDPAGVAMNLGAGLYPQLMTDLAASIAACVTED